MLFEINCQLRRAYQTKGFPTPKQVHEVVFLQTFFAGLRRLVLGQTTSGIDAKCGDHFLHADFPLLIQPRMSALEIYHSLRKS
jgi:hypothetical protein